MTDYKLANLRKKELKLSQQREEILKLEPDVAVDSLLSSPQPATLIQSFPSQDLYFLMHSTGTEDFIPVLALASSDQWEYILDMDIWEGDKPDQAQMTKALDLLFKADPQRLMRWSVKEKVDLLEYYFLKNMDIWIREHDDVPPDEDDFITFDDKFYFRFPKAYKNEEGQPAQELIVKMLESVAQMDISVFHALLLETDSVLGPEVEEEQFRLKNIRLAEKGFLPSHEAVGIYQPFSSLKLRKRPLGKKKFHDSDIPAIPIYISQAIKNDNLFAASLKTIRNDIFSDLQIEFTSLVNKIISADKIKVHEREDLEKVVEKTCAYLSVGIERVNRKSPESVIEKYFLEDIFRAGSSEILKLGRRVHLWHAASFMNENSLPLSFLDEKWLGITGGLMLDRPLFFDSQSSREAYRNFKSLKEVDKTASEVDKIIAIDKILGLFDIDIQSFSRGILTYKSMLLTLWTKKHLDMDMDLSPIPGDKFKAFFKALFSNKKELQIENIKREDFILWVSEVSKIDRGKLSEDFVFAAHEMFDELEEEYGAVSPNDIDIRFIRHFLLK